MQENQKLMISETDVEVHAFNLAKGRQAPPLCDFEADLVHIMNYRLSRVMSQPVSKEKKKSSALPM